MAPPTASLRWGIPPSVTRAEDTKKAGSTRGRVPPCIRHLLVLNMEILCIAKRQGVPPYKYKDSPIHFYK